jgi:hypothetical protein
MQCGGVGEAVLTLEAILAPEISEHLTTAHCGHRKRKSSFD